jgi:hypothetical protein
MINLLNPEVWHLVFAVGGALFGWWLRHQQAGPSVPAELADALNNLLDKKKQQEAHGLLEELLAALRAGQPAAQQPPPPRAGG